MPSSPWPPTAGAPPPRAAQDLVSAAARERHPVEVGSAVAQEARARLPSEDYFLKVKMQEQEHEEKINRYQAILAARVKAKYFSSKNFEQDVAEEIIIQSETIRLSRFPFTRLFADPAKFYREKSYTEKEVPPSLSGEAISND